ncbi:hypothetical protein CVIRNUC_006540 [Coccomyxa viridis]|uniref:Tafazzin family protein n=1 Tax=Coccomyxa viridis TaxID=1274662 RepID=A0AAV1I903_9CHLO|nr:hypothetical protein CVIRNUC_006540 [Coccomyxa viridis]
MPILNSSATPHLAAASVRGYRELLRKFNRDQAEDIKSSSLLQQAKCRVLHYKRSRRLKEPIDPRRAFSRLLERLFEVNEDLSQLKADKRELLRATYAAVRGEKAPDAAAATISAPDDAILGREGPLRSLVLASVGAASKAFMQILSRTHVEGGHIMQQALQRPTGQALITVSNHVASLDDPLLTSALVPAGALLRPQALRWTLCATDRCFTSKAATAFFRAAKVLPIERGAGLQQQGMQAAEGCLNRGDWVHVFPEGTRSMDGRMRSARRGIGRLVAACAQPPLVVPFVHSGMEQVLPKGAAVPKAGRSIRVLVGEPVAVADLQEAALAEGWPDQALYSAIADRIGQELHMLKARLEGLPVSEVVQDDDSKCFLHDDDLMPLFEQEYNNLSHPLSRMSVPQSCNLASISSRATQPAPTLALSWASQGAFPASPWSHWPQQAFRAANFEQLAAVSL